MSDEAPETLVKFAQQLSDCLTQSYPEVSPTTLAKVENKIRETWHCRHDMILAAANYDYCCARAVGGACANISAVWVRLSLINSDEICFGEDVLVCFAGDVATGRVLTCCQTID